ncbi:helix-turn-helix domain-containing protein [Aurantimonas sp. A2-1-M11]|uniref:helix-turn-helix domain-containing protein n=1 Tax=Aurantimonas sp. A2-1-M11 TaxID=3113712 RepID=UPI002F93FC9A
MAALDLVRIGDPDRPLHILARTDDPSLLLRVSEEAVLSAFPETDGTTISKIAGATHRPPAETASVIESLVEKGLVEIAGRSRDAALHRLTPAGRGNGQRNPAARTADLPALPVRSDRVRQVLAHLVRHGPARTRSIAEELEIPRISMNALMQYLKRKELVRKTADELHAPYEITTAGRETGRALEAKFCG